MEKNCSKLKLYMSYPSPTHTINPILVFQILPALTVLFFLGALGEWLNPWLLYERTGLESGEVWRLFSAHIVHLGMTHCILNAVGLCLILQLFKGLFRSGFWWFAVTSLSMGISALFYWLNPGLAYYGGLSGVLHGLLALALVTAIFDDKLFRRPMVVLAVVAVIGKLIYEQTSAYSAGYIEDAMGAPVVVDSHLYGAILGAILALVKRGIAVLRKNDQI